jgi:hypothetical protein
MYVSTVSITRLRLDQSTRLDFLFTCNAFNRCAVASEIRYLYVIGCTRTREPARNARPSELAYEDTHTFPLAAFVR